MIECIECGVEEVGLVLAYPWVIEERLAFETYYLALPALAWASEVEALQLVNLAFIALALPFVVVQAFAFVFVIIMEPGFERRVVFNFQLS